MRSICYILIAIITPAFLNADYAPVNTGAFSAINNKKAIKVMTYNIHHANPPSKAKDSTIDLKAVARVINQQKPDLVALQEVDVNNDRSGINLNEAEELGKLTGMHFYFTKAIDYRGGQYGDAVLSRFPIVDTMSYHLPIIKGTKAETRSLCMIKVALPDKEQVYFASTHLDQYHDPANRLLQAHKLSAIIKSLSAPLILAGDFNAVPESPTIKLMDSVMTRSCLMNCQPTIPTYHPVHKIDYIMYRPTDKFATGKEKVINEKYASDHLPVVVALSMK